MWLTFCHNKNRQSKDNKYDQRWNGYSDNWQNKKVAILLWMWKIHRYTVWKVSKYGVFSGPYSVRMRENADQKNLRIWTLFTYLEKLLSVNILRNSYSESIRKFLREYFERVHFLVKRQIWSLNPLSANPTKWSNTLKQFVGNSWRIVWVGLTILWG